MNLAKTFRMYLLIAAALFAAVCCAYAPAMRGTFLLDDEQFIQKNRWVHEARFDKIFTTDVTDGAGQRSNFYRPLQQSAFAIVWHFFGGNKTAFHLLSIVTHGLNAVLVYTLLEALAFAPVVSGFSAALWALHPVQSEAVAFVSGYADVLGLCCLLSALILVVRAKSSVSWLRIVGVVGFLLSAQTAKESMVIAAPVMILFWLYAQRTSQTWKKTAGLAAMFATMIAVVYLALKFTVFDFTKVGGLTTEHNVYTEHLWVRLWTFVHVVPEYAKLIVWPVDLFYTKPYVGYIDLSAWTRACGGLGIIAAIFSGAIWTFFGAPRAAIGFAFAACAIVPFAGIVPLNAMYLEHWLYVPTLGLALVAATWFDAMKSQRAVLAVVLAVVALCGLRTSMRASEWADYERFYLNEIKHGAATAMVYNNMAMYYAEHKDGAKAKEFYRKAAAAMPRPEPLYNLSAILIREGNFAQAREALLEALRRDPQFHFARERLEKLDLFLAGRK